MNKRIVHLLLPFLVLAFAACGGGGTPAAPPTRAIVKLSTTGPSGSRISGIDVTIGLPAGVTVQAAVNPPETDSGVVVASGQAAANSLVAATYTAAAAGSSARVRTVLVNSNSTGFALGEFATISCDLASGVNPAASDFPITSISISDLNGQSIGGATVSAGIILQ